MTPNRSPEPRPGGVDIVIVNWNSGELLGNCLRSIAAYGGARVDRVTVVDNGSNDGSATTGDVGIPVDLVAAGENLGFGKACNLGARRGTAPLILFFNPDAELRDGAIDRAAAFLESPAGRDVGVCGVKLVDQHGAAHRHCARYPTWRSFVGNSLGLTRLLRRWFSGVLMNDFDHLSSRPVDHVMGAFYLIRRNLFEALGGFDERYFVYLEDLDLSYRVHRAGQGVHYLAEATAYHKQGGTSEQVKAHRLFYSLHANIVYAWKHLGPVARVVVVAVTLLVEPFSRSVRAVLRGSLDELRFTLHGFGMLYGALPRIFRSLATVYRAR